MDHMRHSGIQLRHGPDRTAARTTIGFVAESFLKVGCVNLPANGLAKASLLFRTRPLSAEGVSTRLISGGSPEVPPAIWAWASGGASTQTRLMEPQITPPFSFSFTCIHSAVVIHQSVRWAGCLGSLNVTSAAAMTFTSAYSHCII